MKNILMVMPAALSNAQKGKIISAAGDNPVSFKTPKEISQKDVDSVDIIIGNVPIGMLNEQKLELMQLTSAGADAYVKPGLLRRDTVLCCCTGAYTQTVSEHALAATLALLKKLHVYRDDQAKKLWTDEGTTGTICGSTVLVVGLGDIGKNYARMAKALGAYVIGIKRRASDKLDYVDELYTTEEIDKLLPRADIVMSAMPSTPDTKHFFSIDRFKAMKDSAVFLNVGRGDAVALDVLYEALSEKYVSCAAVDVFEQEPLPESSPLWELPNLLLTPHASGFFHLPVTLDRVIDICADNLKAFLEGKELVNIVDYNTGYKK